MGRAQVLVDIDLARLAAHLSSEDQRPVSVAECRRWLLDAGFKPQGDRWLVDERDLGQLDPSEVRSLERLAPACATPLARVESGSLAHGEVGRRHRRWLGSRRCS